MPPGVAADVITASGSPSRAIDRRSAVDPRDGQPHGDAGLQAAPHGGAAEVAHEHREDTRHAARHGGGRVEVRFVEHDDLTGEAEELLHGARLLAERARHEQEHAESQCGGHVGHDARHPGVCRQRRAQLLERDPGGDGDERPVAEQRSHLGEHRSHVLWPYGHDDHVRVREEAVKAGGHAGARGPGGALGGLGDDVQIREGRRSCELRPAPPLSERAGDVPRADEPDSHGTLPPPASSASAAGVRTD